MTILVAIIFKEMIRIGVIGLLLMSCSVIFAQKSEVDSLFELYSGKEGFTSVLISEYMFSLYAAVKLDSNDIGRAIKGLTGIRILASDSLEKNRMTHRELIEDLKLSDYKELLQVKDNNQEIKFLVKERKGVISEILLISSGKENVLISVQGEDISLQNIANLSKSLKIKGLEKLNHIRITCE